MRWTLAKRHPPRNGCSTAQSAPERMMRGAARRVPWALGGAGAGVSQAPRLAPWIWFASLVQPFGAQAAIEALSPAGPRSRARQPKSGAYAPRKLRLLRSGRLDRLVQEQKRVAALGGAQTNHHGATGAPKKGSPSLRFSASYNEMPSFQP